MRCGASATAVRLLYRPGSRRAIVPVDFDGVSVLCARIGETTVQGCAIVFVDARWADGQAHICWRDIFHYDASCVLAIAAVLVNDAAPNRVAAIVGKGALG